MSLAGWFQRAEQLEQLHAERLAEHKQAKAEAHPQSRQKILQRDYPDRIPATAETLAKMPVALIRFYQDRNISELAAKCVINECVYSKNTRGGRKSVQLDRKPEDVRTRAEGTYLDLRKTLASRRR